MSGLPFSHLTYGDCIYANSTLFGQSHRLDVQICSVSVCFVFPPDVLFFFAILHIFVQTQKYRVIQIGKNEIKSAIIDVNL